MTQSPAALRLLVVNEFFHPDVCASAAVLTDHLTRIAALRPDWRITVIAGNRAWDRPDVVWPPAELHRGVEIIRIPRAAMGRSMWRRGLGFAGFHLNAARAGRRLARPDVIMSTTAPPLGGRIGLRLARQFGCPHVYRVFDLYPDTVTTLGVLSANGLPARIWRRLDTTVMRGSAVTVAISQGIADRIIRERRIPRDFVRVIYDGFDPLRVRPIAAEENAFRRECGLQDRFVVQYAGNMGRSHPFDTILDAARELNDARFVFQFIGAGPGRAVLEAASESLKPRVQVLDFQPAERLSEVLSTADVALISQAPGLAEVSLPYKFYGILAAGRPGVFIGPEASEIVRLYRESGAGLHMEQGNASGLTAALRRLADDDAARTSMGGRARALFEDRFRSDRAAEAWADLLADVAQRTRVGTK